MLRRDPNVVVGGVTAKLRDAGLDRRGMLLLIGVSGGADSMALLHVMAQIADSKGVRLHVVHVNHGIRTDAAQDHAIVEKTCRAYGIPLSYENVDSPATALVTGTSLEIAARTLRYACFAQHYRAQQADALLTAHNQNDQAETVLLNLGRGCSPAALAGIPEDTMRLGVRIVRPLLHCTRKQIMQYLQKHEYTWHEDSTNTNLAYRRNVVRHKLLPNLRKHLNPQMDKALLRCAALAHEDEVFLQCMAQQYAESLFAASTPPTIMLLPYRQTPKPLRTRLIVDWLWRTVHATPGSVSYDMIQRVDQLALHHKAGQQVSLPNGYKLQHAYDRLVLLPSDDMPQPAPTHVNLSVPGITSIPERGCQVVIHADQGFKRQHRQCPGVIPASCHIRIPKEGETLVIRNRRDGDRIAMTGAKGHSKLQDIFTDAKVPAFARDQILLLAAEDHVIWIPGLRVSRDWAVAAPDAPSLKVTIAPF